MKKVISTILTVGVILVTVAGCGNNDNDTTHTGKVGWDCTSCSATDNAGNFCIQCGAAKDSSENNTWACTECGEEAYGNFCTYCGTPKGGVTSTTTSVAMTEEVTTSTSEITTTTEDNVTVSTSDNVESTQPVEEDKPNFPEKSGTDENGDTICTLESPAKLGEWVPSYKYNVTSGEYEKLYVRVTKVLSGKAAQAVLDDYNSKSKFSKIEISNEQLLEPCVAYYEMIFPDTWTVDPSLGIMNPSITLRVCAYDGKTVEKDSMWLFSFQRDITSQDFTKKYKQGDIFTGGMCVYAMFKDYDDYLINIGDGDTKAYIRVK